VIQAQQRGAGDWRNVGDPDRRPRCFHGEARPDLTGKKRIAGLQQAPAQHDHRVGGRHA
jgi:hypothetical protein